MRDQEELKVNFDGGIDAKGFIDSNINVANQKEMSCTFVADFFRSPQYFLVNNEALINYLNRLKVKKNDRERWTQAEKVLTHDELKNIFKDFCRSKNNQVDDVMLTAFVGQWNQFYIYVNQFLSNRLPFIAGPEAFIDFTNTNLSVNPGVSFDRGRYEVHLTIAKNEIKMEMRTKFAYKFNADQLTTSEEDILRPFSDCSQILTFKNVAASGEKARYEVSYQSTELSNPKVKALLEKPYANREYHLQRELLCEVKLPGAQPDPAFDALLTYFDKKVVEEVKNTQDCRHMDLTAVNLSGLDLSNKNLTGANLTGANLTGANLTGVDLTKTKLDNIEIDKNTKLIGAKFPSIDQSTFTVKYEGAKFEHDSVIAMSIKLRNDYYAKTGSVAPQLNNFFELLRYLQENPNDKFSKMADRELTLTVTRKLAEKPKNAEADKYSVSDYLQDWVTAVNSKGLHTHQISQVIQYEAVSVQGQPIVGSRYTAANGDSTLSFRLFDHKVSNAESRAVIQVEQTLSQKETGASFISPLDFAALIESVSKPDKKIDCIQMPLAVMEKGREHYIQLQIYKTTDGGIGARLVDSTANPIAIPVDFVKSILAENREQLKTVLSANKDTITVTEVHTNEQLRLGDKKCGLYVAAGMKATTEKVLTAGAGFLTSDTKAKDAVRHQHHLVSKTETEGYLMGMVKMPIKQQQKVAEPITVNAGASNTSASEQSLDTMSFPDSKAKPSAEAASSEDDLSQPLLSDKNNSSDDFKTIEAPEQTQKQEIKPKNAYQHIDSLLNKMDGRDLLIAVDKALRSYREDRRGFGLSFFRQISSAGKDYAVDAQTRIRVADDNAKQAVAREIAREIMFMGVQKDGQTMEVKHNSRVHHLLKQMVSGELMSVEKNVNLLGRMPVESLAAARDSSTLQSNKEASSPDPKKS